MRATLYPDIRQYQPQTPAVDSIDVEFEVIEEPKQLEQK